MWKTGHSHIKAKLHEEKAALAGEMSGHIFFVQNYYGFDDGVYAGLRFAEYVSQVGKPVSEIVAGTPYYISTPAIDVDCPDDRKYEVAEKLTAIRRHITIPVGVGFGIRDAASAQAIAASADAVVIGSRIIQEIEAGPAAAAAQRAGDWLAGIRAALDSMPKRAAAA